VGLGLGRGQSLQEVLAGMSQVAEGVRTAQSVHDLSRKLGVDMPLHEAIYLILYENLTPKAALQSLSSRELKSEFQLH
jgi:glycerol-3-phosphate dehydrogenase (NAD(P)+)